MKASLMRFEGRPPQSPEELAAATYDTDSMRADLRDMAQKIGAHNYWLSSSKLLFPYLADNAQILDRLAAELDDTVQFAGLLEAASYIDAASRATYEV